MKYGEDRAVHSCVPIPDVVERDPRDQRVMGSYAVDGLLHLPVPAVASLHGVGGRRKKRIVEEGERLFEIRAEKLLEGLADLLEASNALAQLAELIQGGLRAAAAVEESVHFVHDLPKGPQVRETSCDLLQGPSLRRGELALYEQVPMLEQIGHLILQVFLAPGQSLGLLGCGPAAREPGHLGLERLANVRDGSQNGLGQFGNDMERADLMRNITEDTDDRVRIQGRTVCGNSVQFKPAGLQNRLETAEKLFDIFFGGIVVEDFVDQPPKVAVVHDRQYAEGPVVQFVGRDVAGETVERPVEVLMLDAFDGFFFPRPRPSSGWWPKARILDGLTTCARTRRRRTIRLPPRRAPPGRRRGSCSALWVGPGRTCPR